jgi:hypothetical protein
MKTFLKLFFIAGIFLSISTLALATADQTATAVAATQTAIYQSSLTLTPTLTNTPTNTRTITSTITKTYTATPTPTYTPTQIYNGNVFFQPTPQSGKVVIFPTSWGINSTKKVSFITIDSLSNTPCTIDVMSNTYTVKRHVEIYTVPFTINMSNDALPSMAIDYGKNTGTSKTVINDATAGNSQLFYQPTPATGSVVIVPTPSNILANRTLDKIVVDTFDNTPAAIQVLNSAGVAVKYVNVTLVPETIDMGGLYSKSYTINYGSLTGSSVAYMSASQGALYSIATPVSGKVLAVPTPSTLNPTRYVNWVSVDYLTTTPAVVKVYLGSVMWRYILLYSTPYRISLNNTPANTLYIDFGTNTGTATTSYK